MFCRQLVAGVRVIAENLLDVSDHLLGGVVVRRLDQEDQLRVAAELPDHPRCDEAGLRRIPEALHYCRVIYPLVIVLKERDHVVVECRNVVEAL